MSRAYYNENDKHAAAWLRELIARDLIAAGDVDERSICDVKASDLDGYEQHHFFAGIGGWSYALRLAGWPDDRPVWTGSCPCQPFSSAGKGKGTDDERHLWPAFRWLIAKRKPAIVFGEQVASKAGRAWLSGVRADLEALGYGAGAADLCAAGVGAPHIRQRLWWVADAKAGRRDKVGADSGGGDEGSKTQRRKRPEHGGGSGGMGNDKGVRPVQRGRENECGTKRERGGADEEGRAAIRGAHESPVASAVGGMGDARSPRSQGHGGHKPKHDAQVRQGSRRHDWEAGVPIPCGDGKIRIIESGSTPLAHGIPARVVRLRGYGNAIVPQVAAEFVAAYLETKTHPQPEPTQ